jgi:hypothetical protein
MEQFLTDYLERLQSLHEDMKETIKELPQAALDWVTGPGMNSLCVLIVHTAGAERYWIGDVACQDPSDRNRGAEFEVHDLAADQLAERLDQGLIYVRKAAENLRLTDLQETRISPPGTIENTPSAGPWPRPWNTRPCTWDTPG